MKRQLTILIGTFLVLLILAFLVLQKPGELSKTDVGEQLFTVDSAAVTKIQVQSSTQQAILFEKQGGEWYITQPLRYKANQQAIAQLIHQVKELVVKTLVSERPEKHALFRVDSSGARVTMWQGEKEVVDCIVGKMAQSYMQTYVRKGTSPEVYVAEGISEFQLRRNVREWRDKTIASAIRENIKSITYQYGDTSFTLQLEDSVWVLGKEKVNESTVQGVLSALSNFQTDDFADTLKMFPKPTAQISYTGIQLQFAFDKQSNRYYVRTSASDNVFIVERWRAEQVLKRKKEFLSKANTL
ncbi:MAG: DUF4340 domain-containing protein [Bacteroidetes bacterium]|nr:DUF4340 domain-containing protein [Bacteroidota bacterium]